MSEPKMGAFTYLTCLEAECEECGHSAQYHGPEGCEFERGDSYESGYAPMALGPCGCTAITYEEVIGQERDEVLRRLDEMYQANLERRAGC